MTITSSAVSLVRSVPRAALFLLVLPAVCLGSATSAASTSDKPSEGLGALATGLLAAEPADRREEITQALNNFHAEEGATWLERRGLRAKRLLKELERAAEWGLVPSDYATAELRSHLDRLRRLSEAERLDFDRALSASALLYILHASHGRIDPTELGIEWFFEPSDEVALETLRLVHRSAESIHDAHPQHEHFAKMLAALPRYRELASRDSWPQVGQGPTLESGDSFGRVRAEALVERLTLEGDLSATAAKQLRGTWPAEGEVSYASELADSVRRFQERMGLEVDGKVGPNTAKALDRTGRELLRTLEINLDRWRSLPELPTGRYVIVDVAEQRARAWEDRDEILDMRAVVGRPEWKTPVFGDEMQYLEINPYWNIPVEIVEDELLPELRSEPSRFAEKDLELLEDWDGEPVDAGGIDWADVEPGDYHFRQRPGPENSLGRIKFMFPNDHDVYLHDTPARAEFERDRRSLSHGCIRLEDPLAFAEWVLDGVDDWDRDRVEQAWEAGDPETQRVDLESTIPVWITYFTASSDGSSDGGSMQFRPDIYGFDAAYAERWTQSD